MHELEVLCLEVRVELYVVQGQGTVQYNMQCKQNSNNLVLQMYLGFAKESRRLTLYWIPLSNIPFLIAKIQQILYTHII